MAELDNDLEELGEQTRKAVTRIYYNRLAILKKGLNYSNTGDFRAAVENYHEYLNILAAYYEVKEQDLRPSILRDEDPSELFLLSQVYWYMVKIYDRNPKLYSTFKKYMDKFILFSKGQKFQYVNSEVLRRFINKSRMNNRKDFVDTYKLLKSKKGNCFISTYLYGDDHLVTQNLRDFRNFLEKSMLGKKMVQAYYVTSPFLLVKIFKNPRFGKLVTIILRPFVYLIHLFWRLKRL